MVAVVEVTAVAGCVTADGAMVVVKDWTAPNEVPTALDAIAQEKYAVPAESPEIACAYATAVEPAPSTAPPAAGARVPKVSLQLPGSTVEYRNQPVAEDRFGFAEPFSVAVVLATGDAAAEVTDGAALVVNESSAPNDVPTGLWAIAQKKYAVPGESPVTACENDTDALPGPRAVPPLAGARVPKASLHAPGLTVS